MRENREIANEQKKAKETENSSGQTDSDEYTFHV